MRILKPKALRKGDVIAIAAPASPPASEEKLEKGIRYLEQLGYRVVLGKNLHKKRGYLAGTDKERASDLNELFADTKIKAIFCARGGYGASRILPLLDYKLVMRNPKILVGYSDITALHLAFFSKSGITSFSGPMVSVEMSGELRGNAEEFFWRAITSVKPLPAIKSKKSEQIFTGKSNTSTGRLLGGNLSLVSALAGTPYFKPAKDSILFFEEIDERPYRIDRMMQQLTLSSALKASRGIVLGNFSGCNPDPAKPSLTLSQVFEDVFERYAYPVVSGVRVGHVKNSLSLPIGVRVRLDGSGRNMEFLESGVS